MFRTSNITGKSIKYTTSKSHDNSPQNVWCQLSNKIHVPGVPKTIHCLISCNVKSIKAISLK